MPSSVLLYATACVFGAAIVRGFSGFGFAMITILSMSLVLPVATIVPAMFMLEIVAGLHLLPSIARHVRWRELAVLVGTAIAATPLGVAALATVPAPTMKIGLAAVILLACAVLLSGYQLRRMPTVPETAATGAAAGLLNGALGIGGPPIIVFFLGSPLAVAAGRASIIAAFLAMDLTALPALAAFGLVTRDSLVLFAWCVAPLAAGVWLGSRWAGRLNETLVRRVILVLLAALALAIGAQGVAELS